MRKSFRMKQIVLSVFAVALASLGSPAFAGSVSGALVTQIIAEANVGTSAVFVYLNIAPTAVAPCATMTTSSYRFAIDPPTPIGVAQISLVLMAKAMGTPIDVVGTTGCDVWHDTETVWYIVAH